MYRPIWNLPFIVLYIQFKLLIFYAIVKLNKTKIWIIPYIQEFAILFMPLVAADYIDDNCMISSPWCMITNSLVSDTNLSA